MALGDLRSIPGKWEGGGAVLEEWLEDGIRHILCDVTSVSQTYRKHTLQIHMQLVRTVLKARQDLLALFIHGGSVVKCQEALVERWPTNGTVALTLGPQNPGQVCPSLGLHFKQTLELHEH